MIRWEDKEQLDQEIKFSETLKASLCNSELDQSKYLWLILILILFLASPKILQDHSKYIEVRLSFPFDHEGEEGEFYKHKVSKFAHHLSKITKVKLIIERFYSHSVYFACKGKNIDLIFAEDKNHVEINNAVMYVQQTSFNNDVQSDNPEK